MAMRSLLRKVPAVARGLSSPASGAPPPPGLGPRSRAFQDLHPAAGSRRFLSQAPGAAKGQAVYSEEMLQEKADRADTEFWKNMKVIQQQRDELWRIEDEYHAILHQQLDTIEKGCNVITFLCVFNLVMQMANYVV